MDRAAEVPRSDEVSNMDGRPSATIERAAEVPTIDEYLRMSRGAEAHNDEVPTIGPGGRGATIDDVQRRARSGSAGWTASGACPRSRGSNDGPRSGVPTIDEFQRWTGQPRCPRSSAQQRARLTRYLRWTVARKCPQSTRCDDDVQRGTTIERVAEVPTMERAAEVPRSRGSNDGPCSRGATIERGSGVRRLTTCQTIERAAEVRRWTSQRRCPRSTRFHDDAQRRCPRSTRFQRWTAQPSTHDRRGSNDGPCSRGATMTTCQRSSASGSADDGPRSRGAHDRRGSNEDRRPRSPHRARSGSADD